MELNGEAPWIINNWTYYLFYLYRKQTKRSVNLKKETETWWITHMWAQNPGLQLIFKSALKNCFLHAMLKGIKILPWYSCLLITGKESLSKTWENLCWILFSDAVKWNLSQTSQTDITDILFIKGEKKGF